jgi:hypothetical protein
MLGRSVVFVDGNLNVEVIGNSVVFCTGTVRSGGIDNSVIFAGGTIECDGRFQTGANFLHPKDTTVMPSFRRFQPAQMGTEIQIVKDQVQLVSVRADTPFGKAGGRAGDRVLSVNGEAVGSTDHLNRLLRRRSVEWLPFAVTVERDGKPVELIVRLESAK